MVYVLSNTGKPLMPTEDHRMVRLLLRDKKAHVVSRTPFTIQMLIPTKTYTQPISLGVNAGSKTVGLSATTKAKELYASEITLRNDVVKLIATRKELRRGRRGRKTRYRKPRFNNRVRSKHKGWLAPSVEQKINTHIQAVKQVMKILPVTKITVETASFDIQKIKNPDISGIGYQQGDQLGFWNVREYVLFRDGHECQCCHGKSKDPVLNVHHIESRQTGGDAPNNLITLCETCHKAYHAGKLALPKHIKRGMSFRDAAFMGIMRWAFYNRLKALYPNIPVGLTYGYITKNTRIRNGLPKTDAIDALCISGNPNVKRLDHVFIQVAKRRHNRQIHKCNPGKGGKRRLNQSPKYVFGFQLFDKILYQNQECFVFGRRKTGDFDIRQLDGTKISDHVSYKKLKKLQSRKTLLISRQKRRDVVAQPRS